MNKSDPNGHSYGGEEIDHADPSSPDFGDSERGVIRTYRLAVYSGIWLAVAIAVTGGLIWLLDGGGLGQYASGPPASGPDVR